MWHCKFQICIIERNRYFRPQWGSFSVVNQQGDDFCLKIRKIQIYFWFNFHWLSHALMKIENHFRKHKCFKNWNYQKILITKKPCPKLLIFNKKKFRKLQIIFDIPDWLWKSKLGTFWQPNSGAAEGWKIWVYTY